MASTFNEIKAFSAAIAERFDPEKIILFGSYAYGTPTEDSDVDLLIIMPHHGNAREKAYEIRSSFSRKFPLDLIVRSKEELLARLKMNDCFLKEITERGRIIYERGN